MFGGQVVCHQYKDGYRFSIDPVLIAHFMQIKNDSVILDMGTGCGIIPMILSYRNKKIRKKIHGIEVQESLYELAVKNVLLNNMEEEIEITQGDFYTLDNYYSAELFHYIFINPPYYKNHSGRVNEKEQIKIARHLPENGVDDMLESCRKVLCNKGKLAIVFPASESFFLIEKLAAYNFKLKRMQFVYSYPEKRKEAKLVLVEAVKNGGYGVKVLPPFYVYEMKNGQYTKEMLQMYGT